MPLSFVDTSSLVGERAVNWCLTDEGVAWFRGRRSVVRIAGECIDGLLAFMRVIHPIYCVVKSSFQISALRHSIMYGPPRSTMDMPVFESE